MPDVMVGLYDYPESSSHPAFNLILRVNFVDGGAENSGFRFIGTHLESADPKIQQSQAAELRSVPANTSLPVVAAMDEPRALEHRDG